MGHWVLRLGDYAGGFQFEGDDGTLDYPLQYKMKSMRLTGSVDYAPNMLPLPLVMLTMERRGIMTVGPSEAEGLAFHLAMDIEFHHEGGGFWRVDEMFTRDDMVRIGDTLNVVRGSQEHTLPSPPLMWNGTVQQVELQIRFFGSLYNDIASTYGLPLEQQTIRVVKVGDENSENGGE